MRFGQRLAQRIGIRPADKAPLRHLAITACARTVWQNAQGHEEIEKLLTELRNLKPRRVYNQ